MEAKDNVKWAPPDIAKIQLYQLLASYCQRYQAIVMQLPVAVFQGQDLSQNSNVSSARSIIHAYIDLCAEQIYINEHGLVPTEVWDEWTQGIWAAFRIKAFRDTLDLVKAETRYAALLKLVASDPHRASDTSSQP